MDVRILPHEPQSINSSYVNLFSTKGSKLICGNGQIIGHRNLPSTIRSLTQLILVKVLELHDHDLTQGCRDRPVGQVRVVEGLHGNKDQPLASLLTFTKNLSSLCHLQNEMKNSKLTSKTEDFLIY